MNMKRKTILATTTVALLAAVAAAADIRVELKTKSGRPAVVCGDQKVSYYVSAGGDALTLAHPGGEYAKYALLSNETERAENRMTTVRLYGKAGVPEVKVTAMIDVLSERVFTVRTEVLNLGEKALLTHGRNSFEILRLQNPPVEERKGVYRFGLEDFYGLKFLFGAGYYTRFVWETLSYTMTSDEPFYVEPFGHPAQRMTRIASYGFVLRFEPGVPQATTIRVEVGGGSREQPEYAAQVRTQIVDRMRLFKEKFPAQLHWPDRRPLLMWIPAADLVLNHTLNPRGYRGARDVTTPEGMAAFRTIALANASNVVKRCLQANAQGAILWDFEGQEDRHATTYIGSPDRILLQAPEMDAVADEMFAVLQDAGLRAGLTLRPQEVKIRDNLQPDYPKTWKRFHAKYRQDSDPNTAVFGRDGMVDEDLLIQHLSRKAGYAYRRWNVTVFYIDSPAGISPHVMTELARLHPDCLFIPEFPVTGYYGSAAPLHLGANPLSGVQLAREVWPDAFGCAFGTHLYSNNTNSVALFTRWVKDRHLPVYEGDPAAIRAILDEHGIPEHHDPARMRWNDNQPVGRALQARWLKLYR